MQYVNHWRLTATFLETNEYSILMNLFSALGKTDW